PLRGLPLSPQAVQSNPAGWLVDGPSWAERDAAGRRAMLTEILAQVSRAALQGEGRDEVLQGIVDCLTSRLPVALASIILLDEEGTHFVHEVWSGTLELDTPAGSPGSEPWPITKGAAGRCIRTGRAQLLTDVDEDPDYVTGHDSVRSEYLVPIRHRGRLLGVLNLESTERDFFTPQACLVFDAVAAQVAGAIHLARVVHELELANRALRESSMRDGLTGIANRRSFDQRLAEDWNCMGSEARSLALLLVDADCFKELNDSLGHQHGDECLRELAQVCADVAERSRGIAARYGGEEMALLLPRHDLEQARTVAEELRRRVLARALAHPASPVARHVTVSIGVAAVVPAPGLNPHMLISAADRGLYMAKASGRNRVRAGYVRSRARAG
ncbi:MAG TPA: sensor domain-containing diguanylate cyclase, partial [Arenimonas sp.]|nr:sensor domain-containing diguanylate cyclase [Arenimonas sp.]